MSLSAALLTTALGLLVALMTLFPYMVFRSHVDRALGRLESVVAAAQQGEQLRKKKFAAVSQAQPESENRDSASPRSVSLKTDTASG